MGFIKKVYFLFSIMLAATLLFVFVCMEERRINKWQLKYWPILIIAIVVLITIEILLFCVTSISRSWPTNIILLVIFTICFAYLVGFICYFYEPLDVFIALLVAVSGFIAMTIYGFFTQFDITVFWSVLFGASIALLVLCIILIFVSCKPLFIFVCILGITLGLIYVAYDTQLIIGGRKYELSEDDYIPAAMMLFVDFMTIFLYAL